MIALPGLARLRDLRRGAGFPTVRGRHANSRRDDLHARLLAEDRTGSTEGGTSKAMKAMC